MLSYEVLGAFALFVFWGNTLLVVLAAGRQLRVLGVRLAAMGQVEHGEIIATNDGGALAVHRVEQIGRRAADDANRKAILFHDRHYASEIAGGQLESASGAITIASASTAQADVWVAAGAQQRAGACPSDEQFARAYGDATKARGYHRTVCTELGIGQPVWVAGQCTSHGGASRILAPEDGRLLVASFDPRRFCLRKRLFLLSFILLTLVVAAAITLLAAYPPLFGTLSTVGGALALLFFLLVQPAGVMARDHSRVPSVTTLRGSWVASGSEGQGGPAAGTELYAD